MKNDYSRKLPVMLMVAMAVGLLCVATPATADLIVAITGVPGAGTTTWTFSGGGTVSTGGTTGTNRMGWNHATADFTDLTPDEFLTATSGTVTVTGAALSSDIVTNGVFVDSESPVDTYFADDIGLWDGSGGNAEGQSFGTGDISWSGVLAVPIDINDLDNTPLPVTFTGFTPGVFSSNRGFTGVNLTLSISAVPEPSAFLFGGVVCSLVGLVQCRRKPARRDVE